MRAGGRRRARWMRWITVLAAIAFVAVAGAGCAAGSTTTSADPPAVAIRLRIAPASDGCDTIGFPYRSIVIRIDAAAADQVWAITDGGARLNILWQAGFVGGTSANPVVFDPTGAVVARDGEKIEIPERDLPRLHGYFVCPWPAAIEGGADGIYVLVRNPS